MPEKKDCMEKNIIPAQPGGYPVGKGASITASRAMNAI
jgi:hypothetical protein